jgi:hypothetical protein
MATKQLAPEYNILIPIVKKPTHYWEGDDFIAYIDDFVKVAQAAEEHLKIYGIDKLSYKSYYIPETTIKSDTKHCMYIIFEHTSEYLLFKIINTNFVPVTGISQANLQKINEILHRNIQHLTIDGCAVHVYRQSQMNENHYNNSQWNMNLDYRDAIPVIDDINQYIQSKCKNMFVEIHRNIDMMVYIPQINNNFSNPLMVNMCLFHKQKCVSSMVYYFRRLRNSANWKLEINSATDEKHSGNKYNNLLRGITIMVAPHFINPNTGRPANAIYSHAINPISVWSLMRHFNARITGSNKPMPFTSETITQHGLTEFFRKQDKTERTEVDMEVELTSENLERAKTVVMNLLLTSDGIKCPVLRGGRKGATKARPKDMALFGRKTRKTRKNLYL